MIMGISNENGMEYSKIFDDSVDVDKFIKYLNKLNSVEVLILYQDYMQRLNYMSF